MKQIEPRVHLVAVSLENPREKFGLWLTEKMNHSGLVLYLILHPEVVEQLDGAECIGLEVNLPTGINVYLGSDKLHHGRKEPKVDLVFKKGNRYYLVEVKDKKPNSRDMKQVREYARRFKENLGLGYYTPKEFPITPIIVYPDL